MRKSSTSEKFHSRQGFTLIELSIVIVIIGLIVGGILTGQSLIKQAQMRATLTLINKIATATNVFRDRFGGLPGDLISYANVGLGTPTTSAVWVGDGLIEDGTHGTTVGGINFNGEVGSFFYHLYQAQILQDFYGATMIPGASFGSTTTSLAVIETYMIPAPIGNGFFIWVASGISANGTALPAGIVNYNYFRLGAITSVATATGVLIDGNKIVPLDAASIDSKLDDGVPSTGNVLAINSASGDMALTIGTSDCAVTATAYDVNTDPTKPECSLAIRAGF